MATTFAQAAALTWLLAVGVAVQQHEPWEWLPPLPVLEHLGATVRWSPVEAYGLDVDKDVRRRLNTIERNLSAGLDAVIAPALLWLGTEISTELAVAELHLEGYTDEALPGLLGGVSSGR